MRTSFAALLLLAVPGMAFAQEGPDLSGFWSPDFDTDPSKRDADLLAHLPDDAVMVEDTGLAEFPRGEFGGLEPTAEALEKAREWEPEDDMTLQRVCLPPSIVYALQGPFPFEIHQGEDMVVFKYEYFDQVRIVFMDGRDHPADAPHSKMGYSTGYWDDGDLVVETSHIAASTITNNGLDHSDEIVMRERYRLSEDGTALMATQWFSDPTTIANDGARYISWTKREGEFVYPYECDPSFGLEYAEREAAE